MAKTIRLHGGPWHGQLVALEDGRDHMHIREAVQDAIDRAINTAAPEDGEIFARVPVREGTYSRVFGSPNDFEWDGWVTHD